MPRATAVLAGLLLALVLVHRPGRSSSRVAGVDFVQFWLTGQQARVVEDVYAREGRERLGAELAERARPLPPEARLARAARVRPVFETYSSPALYALFGAAATADYERDVARYQAAAGVVFLAGLLLLALAAGLGVVEATLLGAFLLLFSAPLASDEQVVNVARLQVGLLGLASLLLGRDQAAAGYAVLGAATLLKPNLALAAALPLVVRLLARRPAAPAWAGLAGGALLAVAVGAAWFGGPGPWARWLAALPAMPAEIIRPDLGNWGLVSLVAARGGRGTALALVAAPMLAAVALVAWHDRARSEVAAVATGALAWLLVSPLTWMTDYLLATPAVVVALAGRNWVATALAATALVLTTTPPPGLLRVTTPTTWCLVYSGAAALLLGALAARRQAEP